MLDEFMARLNPIEVAPVIELIKKVRNLGVTIIMIEHVMKVIMDIPTGSWCSVTEKRLPKGFLKKSLPTKW